MYKSFRRRWPLKIGMVGVLALAFCLKAIGQKNGELSVLVQNSENKAMSDATVRVHNARLQLERLASSDAQGRAVFSNLPADSNYCVTVTYVGMLPKEECSFIITDGQRSSAILTLGDPSLNEMDQVVVTAIGIRQQKRKIGYATQEVDTEVLQESKTMNIGNALTGQVAGLIVNNPTGIFQAPTFNLRGRSPLIVVDGVPIESDLFDIPAQHIENINVLKGTAASVLYGFRGRDGAIMITTKNARKEGLEITVGSTNMVSGGFTVFPESQTEFGSGSNGQYEFWDGADGGISDGDMTWGPKLNTGLKLPQWNSPIRDKQTGEEIPWWGDVSGTIYDDKSRYERIPIEWVSHDNLRDFLGTGFVTENNFTLSHKSEKLSLFTSGKYAFQKGQVPNTSLNSGGFNVNSNYRFSPNLNLDINFSYNKVKSPNYPRYGYGPRNHMYTILLWMGNDVNGKELAEHFYVPGQEGYRQANYNYAWYNNPWFAAHELNQVYDLNVAHAQSRLSWQITPKFNVQGRIAARQRDLFKDMQSPKSYMNYGDSRNGDYKMWNDKQLNFDADVLATYTEQFGENFGLNINAGASTFKRTLSENYQSTDGLVVPFVYNLGNTQGPVKATNANYTTITRSAYASISLDLFRSTYLNFSGRSDWSSTLLAENNPYFYPAVSFSTILSDYIAMPQYVDYLKVYSSWASVSQALDPYKLRAVYNKGLTYGATPSVTYPNGIVNPNIRPEKSGTWEIGLATAFLHNRFNIEATYYNMVDDYSIIPLDISDASGFVSRMVNGNTYRTRGLEVMLGARVVDNDNFKWTTAVNWTHSVRRLEEIYGDQPKFGNLPKGARADAYYDQVWQKNANGDLILNPTTGMPIRDPFPRYLGYFNPDWQFGFSNTFAVKDFRIQMDIDGSIGGVMRSQTIEKMWWGGKHPSSTLYRQQEYDAGEFVYVPEGVVVTGGEVKYDVDGNITEDTRTFAPYTDAVSWQTWSQIYPYQARVTESESKTFANVYDRTFVKLRRLSVGYDLNKLIKSERFGKLDASIFGTNLLVWKKIPYIDPDFGIGNDDNLQDPSTRYIGVSLNLSF